MDLPTLYPALYEPIVRHALAEDLGRAGDVTSDAVVPDGARTRAALVARREGRVAGLDVAAAAFRLLDPAISIHVEQGDGSDAAAGATLAVIDGPARPVLSAERTALNFLGRLCGIATATRTAVRAVEGLPARIVCTRKTTPGLRILEKYAVRAGGGTNHRFGLDDGVLIKDNHIVSAGGIDAAVRRAREAVGHMMKIEVEVDTIDQLKQLLPLGADAVLLDNMSPDELREAVGLVDGRMATEASGGLTPDTVRAVAETGVDIISLGWLTHSVTVLDVGLDFEAS